MLSILAHELSHALVGRANGVPVAGITLFIFGGVAHMRGEPRSPRAELLMTVVGPLTSLAHRRRSRWLAAPPWRRPRSSTPAIRCARFRASGPLATVLLWLGPINIMIGLFNLMPGFPLDGGRVLRAALWAATRDFAKATRWAAGVGQAFGAILIVAGISMMFGIAHSLPGAGPHPGAVGDDHRLVPLRRRGGQLRAGRHLRPAGGRRRRAPHAAQAATLDPELPVANLVDEYLMSTAERAFPVVDGDRLIGIVTLEDVRKVSRAEWPSSRVRDIMTPARALSVVTPDDSAAAALAKLSQRDVAQLPVVDRTGQLVGMIRRRDILRWLELQPRPRPRDARPRERHA